MTRPPTRTAAASRQLNGWLEELMVQLLLKDTCTCRREATGDDDSMVLFRSQ
jgi:hypothetical protein